VVEFRIFDVLHFIHMTSYNFKHMTKWNAFCGSWNLLRFNIYSDCNQSAWWI